MSDYEIYEDEISEELSLIIAITLKNIFNDTDYDHYLAWAHDSLPVLMPNFFDEMPQGEMEKAVFWMARNLWCSAPHPSNHYKPITLSLPGRNEKCPCGSGKKYKHCCISLSQMPPLESALFWTLIPDVLSKTTVTTLCKEQEISLEDITQIAYRYDEKGDPQQVIRILDPLFAGKAPRLNKNGSGLLDLLVDAYNFHYRTDRKKRDLLQRLTQHHDKTIRAEAWQRIASWQQDEGDISGAKAALAEAMRAEPNNPSHALLEIILLVDSNEIELAKQRAQFWYRKLYKYQDELPDFIELLHQAKQDPLAAVMNIKGVKDDSMIASRLLNWIRKLDEREIPLYILSKGMDETTDQNELVSRKLQDKGLDHSQITEILQQLSEAEEQQEHNRFTDAVTFEPPESVKTIERLWQPPVSKPFSVHMQAFGNNDMLDELISGHWLEFLEQNPLAADSVNILDDIALLIEEQFSRNDSWGMAQAMLPYLLNRALGILDKAIGDKPTKLLWVMTENRPILRLLVRMIMLADDMGDSDQSTQLIIRYLSLNPDDNHGYRTVLMNQYIAAGDNESALELADAYPDDMFAEIIYGKILALYRLQRLGEAEQSLLAAYKTLPLVAEYLLKSRVTKPKMDGYGISMGGKEQAWLYRHEMRGIWLQAPRSMKWLQFILNKQK